MYASIISPSHNNHLHTCKQKRFEVRTVESKHVYSDYPKSNIDDNRAIHEAQRQFRLTIPLLLSSLFLKKCSTRITLVLKACNDFWYFKVKHNNLLFPFSPLLACRKVSKPDMSILKLVCTCVSWFVNPHKNFL